MSRSSHGSVSTVNHHPTPEDVYAARARIAGRVRRTPLVLSEGLSARVGVPTHLKLENAQETGSFKLRGATSTLLSLSDAERTRGVVAVSSGNHGKAVAHVARAVGAPATICLTERVPAVKREAIASLGARVVIGGDTQDEAEAEARRLVDGEGLVFVHPFDDPRVIAGQGTIGIEILEDLRSVATAIVPMSGGGLISGIAVVLKAADPKIRVVGVSQDRGPAMYDSLRAGRIVAVVEEDTLADALAGGLGEENHHTFQMCRDLVDETVLVSEEEIADAMAFLNRDDGQVVEGGGAVGVAALLAGRVVPEGGTVVVVSGGNVDPGLHARVVAGR
jgi:threonine dehydratase